MSSSTKTRKAIGIVRVSRVGGRDGESFISPDEQRDRIRALCDRDDQPFDLIETFEELDVSGGTPLDKRDGLRRALEAVESGRAQVVVGAYFDRLFRSIPVQYEFVSRVENAGGKVFALDAGQVTRNGSAVKRLNGTILGAMAEYTREAAGERVREAHTRAVARGVLPTPGITPGYVRGDDGVLVPDPEKAPIVAEAFQLRAGGASVREVRAFLRENGIERSYHGVVKLLATRTVLGEIHFGDLENLDAHDPIVDRGVWKAVQRTRVTRGRKGKSDRLLARQGVLRCHEGARMIAGVQTKKGREYHFYRCPQTGDCERKITISAKIVEGVVVDAVRERLGKAELQATVESHLQEAQDALSRAQDDLNAAIRAFVGLEDEEAARERLAELRDARDRAQERVDELGEESTIPVTIRPGTEWDDLDLDAQRMLIRALVLRVEVRKGGRGAERITVTMDDYEED